MRSGKDLFALRNCEARDTHTLDDKSPLFVLKIISIGLLDRKQTGIYHRISHPYLHSKLLIVVFFLADFFTYGFIEKKPRFVIIRKMDSGCCYLEQCDRDVDVLWDGPNHHAPVRVLDPRLPTVELHNKQPSETRARQHVSPWAAVFMLLPWNTCVGSFWSTPPSPCLVACGHTQTWLNRLSST